MIIWLTEPLLVDFLERWRVSERTSSSGASSGALGASVNREITIGACMFSVGRGATGRCVRQGLQEHAGPPVAAAGSSTPCPLAASGLAHAAPAVGRDVAVKADQDSALPRPRPGGPESRAPKSPKVTLTSRAARDGALDNSDHGDLFKDVADAPQPEPLRARPRGTRRVELSQARFAIPSRGHVDDFDDLRSSEVVYCGRSHHRYGLPRSRFANWPAADAGVKHDRIEAVKVYRSWLQTAAKQDFKDDIVRSLNGKRLACHCRRHQACHTDALIEEFRRQLLQRYPEYDVPLDEEIRKCAMERISEKGGSVNSQSASGPPGVPPPLMIRRAQGLVPVVDGAGLCSWGRAAPNCRPAPCGVLAKVQGILVHAVMDVSAKFKNGDRGMLSELVNGRGESIFDPGTVSAAKAKITSCLQENGVWVSAGGRDRPQPIDVRLLQSLLVAADDPDHQCMDLYALGVPIGVGVELPRTPHVFEEKDKWPIKSQRDASAHEVDWDRFTAKERSNYASAKEYPKEVEALLEEMIVKGQAFKLDIEEARARFGNKLTIASLGAQVKDRDEHGAVSLRLLYDGTHGIDVNTHIRVRDAVPFPRARDIRRVLREAQECKLPAFHVKLDVKDAHKTIQIQEDDWPFMCCRATDKGPVFVNTCGTFGISSAAYWWGRMAAAIHRLGIRLTAGEFVMWLLLFADDWWIMSQGARFASPVMVYLLLLVILGVPLSWKKAGGGMVISWVGYEINTRAEWSLGISERRAAWLTGWYDRVLRDKMVCIREFEEALGRMGFVYGAIEYDQPFLGPLYRFASLHARSSVVEVPMFVDSILRWLRDGLQRRRASTVREFHRAGALFRVDAKAEGDLVSVAGWETSGLVEVQPGRPSTKGARWFAIKLTKEEAPWAFARGEPFKAISALELLASTIAFTLFAPKGMKDQEVCFVASGFTDSQVATRVVQKHMSTKFPLYLIAMELSAQLEARGSRLIAEWAPRELNQQADDLTNGVFEGFSPDLRVAECIADVEFLVLSRLLEEACAFQRACEAGAPPRMREARAAQRPIRLREREPW